MFSIEILNMDFHLPTKNGYFMYSKSNCKFCKMAKELLPDVTVVNADVFIETDKSKFLDKMATIAEAEVKTFPIVFYNRIFIGGYTESKDHFNMME